jgi:hypothetical protein
MPPRRSLFAESGVWLFLSGLALYVRVDCEVQVLLPSVCVPYHCGRAFVEHVEHVTSWQSPFTAEAARHAAAALQIARSIKPRHRNQDARRPELDLPGSRLDARSRCPCSFDNDRAMDRRWRWRCARSRCRSLPNGLSQRGAWKEPAVNLELSQRLNSSLCSATGPPVLRRRSSIARREMP